MTTKLYEYRVLTRNGLVTYSEGYCAKHWLEAGKVLYETDPGPKQLREHEMSSLDVRLSCILCQEQGE